MASSPTRNPVPEEDLLFPSAPLQDLGLNPPSVGPGTGPLLAVLVARGAPAGVPERFSVRQVPVAIGRGAGQTLRLSVPSVSETHAELSLGGGVWNLRDAGSANGSWVDGEPVVTTLPVAPGSTIRLGEVEFVLVPHDRWEHSQMLSVPDVVDPPTSGIVRRPVAPQLFLQDEPASSGWMWLVWAGVAVILAAGLAIFFSRGG